MTSTKAHKYNWHKENREGTFLSWFTSAAMSMAVKYDDPGFFEEMSKATNGFSECTVGITLNGVEVDAEKFVKRLDEAIDDSVTREAASLIRDMQPLQTLLDAASDLNDAISAEIKKKAEAAGLDVTWED